MGITENGRLESFSAVHHRASLTCLGTITDRNQKANAALSRLSAYHHIHRRGLSSKGTVSSFYRESAALCFDTRTRSRRGRGRPLAQRQRHAELQTSGICSMFQDRCRALFDVWLCGSLCVAGMPFDVCWLELTVRVWVAWGGGVLVLHGAALGDPGVDD
jgi:hypothetical protein